LAQKKLTTPTLCRYLLSMPVFALREPRRP